MTWIVSSSEAGTVPVNVGRGRHDLCDRAAPPEDAASLGPLQLRIWLQTYPDEAAGIDEAWIREQRGTAATEEGVAGWREFIEAAERRPDLSFCRVVRSGAGSEIVGFLCGRRGEAVSLGPMYLLEEVRATASAAG